MVENPYRSPNAGDRAVGVRFGTTAELRKVAQAQKGVLLCLLIQICLVAAQLFVPPEMATLIAIGGLLVGVAATVFVFMLATNVYSTALGILALVPCVGLIVLLVVNGKATSVLRENGIKVGLLGANLSQI